MGGGGESAPNVIEPSKAAKMMEKNALLSRDPKIAKLLSDYGTGAISLKDAMAAGQGLAAMPDKQSWLNERMGSGLEAKKAAWTDRDLFDQTAGSKFRTKDTGTGGKGLYKSKYDYGAGGEQGYTDEYRKWADERFKDSVTGDLNAQYDKLAQDNPYAGTESMMMDLLTTNPLAAQRYGTDELKTNSLTSGIFGEGGFQDRLQESEKELTGITRGNEKSYQDLLNQIQDQNNYKLTNEDQTAYGQASGDIARLAGQQDNEAMANLAARGLASGTSGAAGAMFSGIQGNKFEQLAKAQTTLADNRYQKALDTFRLRGDVLGNKSNTDLNNLNSTRTNVLNTGALGQTALSNLFNRNAQGRQMNENSLGNAADKTLANQIAAQNQLNTQFSQEQGTKGFGVSDMLGAAVGGGIGAFTGGAGTAIGAGLGKSLFGGNSGGQTDYAGLDSGKYKGNDLMTQAKKNNKYTLGIS